MIPPKNSQISLVYCGINASLVLIDNKVDRCYFCPSVLFLFLVEKFLVHYSCKIYVSIKLLLLSKENALDCITAAEKPLQTNNNKECGRQTAVIRLSR